MPYDLLEGKRYRKCLKNVQKDVLASADADIQLLLVDAPERMRNEEKYGPLGKKLRPLLTRIHFGRWRLIVHVDHVRGLIVLLHIHPRRGDTKKDNYDPTLLAQLQEDAILAIREFEAQNAPTIDLLSDTQGKVKEPTQVAEASPTPLDQSSQMPPHQTPQGDGLSDPQGASTHHEGALASMPIDKASASSCTPTQNHPDQGTSEV